MDNESSFYVQGNFGRSSRREEAHSTRKSWSLVTSAATKSKIARLAGSKQMQCLACRLEFFLRGGVVNLEGQRETAQ